jgi:peptidase M48-like protein
MKKLILAAASAVALTTGCQTFQPLPETARLVTLVEAPPKYEVFAQRRESDATAARSLGGYRGSRQLALLANDEGYTILADSEVLQNKLGEFYAPLLPDALVNLPETTLPETTFFIAEQNGLNAHALNTGDIVIESGVVSSIDTFDEVNFVLAHEGAHILLDHFRTDELKKIADTATTLAYFGALYADNQKNAASYGAGGGPSAQLSYATVAVVGFSVITNLLAERREKQQEIEADQLGLEMLVGAENYNSHLGASKLIERLVNFGYEDLESEKIKVEKVEADLERVCGPKQSFGATLLGDILAGAASLPATVDTRPTACQFRDKGLLQIDRELKAKEKNLERRKERLTLMRDYQNLRYGDVTVYPPTTEIKTANGRNSFAALFDPDGPVIRLEEVRDVRSRLDKDDCLGAQILAKQYLRGEDDTFASLREAFFDADVACGEDDPGRHAKIAHFGGGASSEFLQKAYIDYNTRQDYESALEMLDALGKVKGDIKGIYAEKIRLLFELGREDEARAVHASCTGDAEINRQTKRLCDERLRQAEAKKNAAENDSEREGAVDDSENISFILDTLSYDVIRAAMLRDDIRTLLPTDVSYVFYVPTDEALRVATGGDPRRLLEPQHSVLLKDIVRSHIVRDPQPTVTLSGVSQTPNAATDSPRFDTLRSARATNSRKILNSFESHVKSRGGMIFGLQFTGEDGEAYLTDTVRLLAN